MIYHIFHYTAFIRKMCQMNFHLIRLDKKNGNEQNTHHIEYQRFVVKLRRFVSSVAFFFFLENVEAHLSGTGLQRLLRT